MKFVGIDLAWGEQKPSGVCCLEQRAEGLTMPRRPESLTGHGAVLAWLDATISPGVPAVVAVDAPLVITNPNGQRWCESEVSSEYSSRHASCHSMNLENPSAKSLLSFSNALEERGFAHGCNLPSRQIARQRIEVYPHPPIIELFGLDSILYYKDRRGRPPEYRANEMGRLRDYILSLGRAQPALLIDSKELPGPAKGTRLSGSELRVAEDLLDGIVCAYLAAHWWLWGLERNTVFGDEAEGYIIVPNGKHAFTESNQIRTPSISSIRFSCKEDEEEGPPPAAPPKPIGKVTVNGMPAQLLKKTGLDRARVQYHVVLDETGELKSFISPPARVVTNAMSVD